MSLRGFPFIIIGTGEQQEVFHKDHQRRLQAQQAHHNLQSTCMIVYEKYTPSTPTDHTMLSDYQAAAAASVNCA
jgi:hypothetical protein